MIRKFFLMALIALFAMPVMAQAQSVNEDASMTAQVVFPLSIVKDQDLAWTTDIVINNGSVNASQWAQWTVTTESGINMQVSMSVPATLANGGNTIDVTYGATSGNVTPCNGVAQQFDPVGGTAVCNGISDGTQDIRLGWGAGGTDKVSTIAPAGSAPGTYTGTATVTVSVS